MNFHLGDSNFSSAGDQADPGDNQERVVAEAFLSELSKAAAPADRSSIASADDAGSSRLTDYRGEQESKSNLAFSFIADDGKGAELKLAARIGAGNISQKNSDSGAAADPSNFYKQGGGARFSFQLHRTEA